MVTIEDEYYAHVKRKRILLAGAALVLYATSCRPKQKRRRNELTVGRVVGSSHRYGSTPGFKRRPMFPDKEGASKWPKWLHEWSTSYWWSRLEAVASNDDPNSLMRATVERKLRLSWRLFLELAEDMEQDQSLKQNHRDAVPLRLKLCAALRHLATGHSFDGLEESFGMSAMTMRRFFWNKFLPWMMKHKYDAVVRAPTNIDELNDVVEGYKYAGFPGCCGSVDGVHIPWFGYKQGNRPSFVGKEKSPTLVFGCTVNHQYRFMYITSAHAGATNDKLVMDGDDFHRHTLETSLYKDYTFELCTSRSETQTWQSCYTLCDSGYASTSNLISAFKYVQPGTAECEWSHVVGSVRKDSECCFGILKHRFRILLTRIYRRDAKDVENLFKVCCALHNMIMDDRGVSPGRGQNTLARLREESAQDDGADLSGTNMHGERVPIAEVYEPVDAPVRSVSASDDGAPEGASESEGAALTQPTQHASASRRGARRTKAQLQNALSTHWRYYKNIHKAEYGCWPFAYKGSLEAHLEIDTEE